MARLAGIQSGNRKLFHCAAHGIPEIDLDLVFQVATGFVLRLAPRASASTAKKLAEEIAEARSAARRTRATAKIKSAKIKVDVLLLAVAVCSTRPARWKVVTVEPVLVVHLPLLGIGENIVGFLQLLEFFFRGFVAGVQIRVILPRQLAKRRTDISGVGLARHSQQFVIISFFCRRHLDLEQTLERGAARLRPSPPLRQLNSAASTRPRPRTRRRRSSSVSASGSVVVFSAFLLVKALDAVMVIFCALLVALSLALTFRVPLASLSNVTSICGVPRGAGRIPSSLNLPSERLSLA